MVYWVTESSVTSLLPYYEFANAGAITWMKEAVKNFIGSRRVPAAFSRSSQKTLVRHLVNGQRVSLMSNAGPRCHGAATLRRWRSHNCLLKTFALGFASFAIRGPTPASNEHKRISGWPTRSLNNTPREASRLVLSAVLSRRQICSNDNHSN